MDKSVILRVGKFRIDDGEVKKEHVILGLEDNAVFCFKVQRLKDNMTYKEVMLINAYYCDGVQKSGNGNADEEKSGHDMEKGAGGIDGNTDAGYEWEYMGKAVGTINKLGDEIRKLCEVGIVMSVNDCRDLEHLISANYYNFEIIRQDGVENDVPDKVVDDVLELFAEYIRNKGIQKKDGLYNIPKEDFKKEYGGCVYDIPINKILACLKSKGYTRCNKNRYDYNVRTDDKTERHVSFYAGIIDKVLPEKKEEKQQDEQKDNEPV